MSMTFIIVENMRTHRVRLYVNGKRVSVPEYDESLNYCLYSGMFCVNVIKNVNGEYYRCERDFIDV